MKYPLLANREWLIQKYENEKLGMNEIAKLLGAKSCNSVRQALLKLGINLRDISSGLTAKRKDEGFNFNLDVITGCLLGDGGLRIHNRLSDNSYPSFYKKNKFYDHVEFVAKLLVSDWKSRIRKEILTREEGDFSCFVFRTLTHKELLPIYRKWYPENNGFVKRIPEDLCVNEEMLLHWFLDDGSTSFRKRGGKITSQIIGCFCSESFLKQDQETLCDKVNQKFNLNFGLRSCNSGTGWRIFMAQKQMPKFFDIIGPPPVKSLTYKWKSK